MMAMMQASQVHAKNALDQHVHQSQYLYPRQAEVIKIAVLGDPGVGKTAFVKCFIFGVYDPYMQSSVSSDFLTRSIQVEDEEVVLQFWEVEPPSYNCLIIMYDITSRETFVDAQKHLEECRVKQGLDLPILLVGNKLDSDSKRQVMSYEGEMLALQCQALFSEVSCVEALNVRQSVTDFIESVLTCHHKISQE